MMVQQAAAAGHYANFKLIFGRLVQQLTPMIRSRLIFFLVCILFLAVGACRNKSMTSTEDARPDLSVDTVKTLTSLKKVNDYPLYSMTYYGDYGENRLYTSRAGEQPGKPAQARDAVWGCTGIVGYGDSAAPVFGRNFDWYDRACVLLFTDPSDGYASVSMVDIRYCGYELNPDLTSLESRIRLLNAPFIPIDGMNEKGVAIGMMAVPSVQLPFDPVKRTTTDLGMIRLVLDHAESTQDAIELIGAYNISMSDVPLHYFVADGRGQSAVVEFVDNRMEVLFNSSKFQVSTNFILHNALPNLTGHCWRYDLALNTLNAKGGSMTMSSAAEILQSVSQPHTMWSSVYGLRSGEVRVFTGRQYDVDYHFTLTTLR